MSSFTSNVFHSIKRHFVSLSCVQHKPGKPEMLWVFSGFLVEVSGEWFYVTAGHILRDIGMCLAEGDNFDVWRLAGLTAGNKFENVGIPFSFDFDRWMVIEDEAVGLDYAAVHVESFFRRQLEADGVVPIAMHAWGDYTSKYDRMAVFGIPKETVTYEQRNLIKARAVQIILSPHVAPATAGVKAENQFYAKLQDDFKGSINDINGMSGGPIFGLWRTDDGTWRYDVIGVQSSWYKELMVIAACPFNAFGHTIKAVVDEALSIAARSHEAD